MADEARTVGGRCLCGAVRLTVTLPTLLCVHCHCTMCQRNHGAGYVTWTAVPPERLKIDGEDALVHYASSEHGTRSFCGRCGTSLLCRIDTSPEHVDIALGCLEEPIDRAPQLHIFWDDRAPWTVVSDELPRLGGETGAEPVPTSD